MKLGPRRPTQLLAPEARQRLSRLWGQGLQERRPPDPSQLPYTKEGLASSWWWWWRRWWRRWRWWWLPTLQTVHPLAGPLGPQPQPCAAGPRSAPSSAPQPRCQVIAHASTHERCDAPACQEHKRAKGRWGGGLSGSVWLCERLGRGCVPCQGTSAAPCPAPPTTHLTTWHPPSTLPLLPAGCSRAPGRGRLPTPPATPRATRARLGWVWGAAFASGPHLLPSS